MDTKNYYKILTVRESSSQEEIKSAYRKLVFQYHPDRVPEQQKKQAEEKFKDIAAAYYVLGDVQRRKEYDDYCKGAYSFRSGHGSGDFASQSGFDFDDLMRHFQDMSASRENYQQESDRYFFFDDLAGIFSNLNSGYRPSDEGYQEYRFVDNRTQQKQNTDAYADLKIPQNVTQNGGEVKVRLSDQRTISLKINPGTKNGQRLRLKGLGKMCATCDHKGDLIVTIEII